MLQPCQTTTTTTTTIYYYYYDFEEIVADAGNNADLYAANQGSTELINETYTEEVPLSFMGQDALHHQPLSLD